MAMLSLEMNCALTLPCLTQIGMRDPLQVHAATGGAHRGGDS
jgi:hypothetical protein